MDATTENVTSALARQRTIAAAISCVGVGLHTGRRVSLTLRPAQPGHGIVFRRLDLGVDIPARFDLVCDTRLSTVLGLPGQPAARVGTVEHLLAALAGFGIDNLLVELDGPEIPILDGSAAPFVFLLECAGVQEQERARPIIEIIRTVRAEMGSGFAELRPSRFGFDMALSIEFEAAAIGCQALSLRLGPDSFRRELARARTFALVQDVEQLQSAGLAQGGNLDNAVVVDGARVLNPSGLRMRDEFVRHKLLDAVGDLSLAGAALRGRFVAHRSGHALNNRLLRAMFAEASAWRFVEPSGFSGISAAPLPAAAASA
jgi:UDP-3-O-[3-hydroxymyristoyl] N-acetylglucosamine deacetylase